MKFLRHLGHGLLLAGVLVWSSCSSVVQTETMKAQVAREARSVLPSRLSEVRLRAWQTAIEITEAYEHIPAERCPGVAALVKDIRDAEAKVGKGTGRDLDRLDVNRLVTHNPHFWRAALEISPSDGSLLLLQATLLASGGDVWRANRILVATTQMLPISKEMRPYYLAHSYGMGSLIMLSVAVAGAQPGDLSSEETVADLENALAFWPNNAVVLSELIDSRIRASAKAAGVTSVQTARERLPHVIETVLAQSKADIDHLFILDPISAGPYRGGVEERKKGRELRALWARLSDSETVLGYKEIGEIAQALEAEEAPELALVLYRLQVVARGFPGPSDVVAWKRVLPRLIGNTATEELFAAADRGEINVVEFSQSAAANLEEWKGDPAIHPLLMQQVEREIADLTFQIDLLNANPEQQSNALRRRAIQKSRAGMDEGALADLNAAIKLVGRQPAVLLEEAAVYSAIQRDDDVEKIFAEVQKTNQGKTLALRERGVFRFGQGRFEEAHALLLEDAKKNPTVPYATIMAELSARRIGQREFALLERARRSVRATSWPGVCLGYLMGNLNEEVLIREAQRGDTLEVAQRLCEAYFILAQVAISSGEQEKGIDLLESCVGTGITGYVEFRLARLELKRVAPDREAKTRKWDDRNPKDRPPPQRLKEKKSIEEEMFDEPVPA